MFSLLQSNNLNSFLDKRDDLKMNVINYLKKCDVCHKKVEEFTYVFDNWNTDVWNDVNTYAVCHNCFDEWKKIFKEKKLKLESGDIVHAYWQNFVKKGKEKRKMVKPFVFR